MAEAAAEAGAEAVIVQGAEAGGHNRAEAAMPVLFGAVRRALPEMPLIASGGIADGRAMAAALMLGAEAVWCGTRFLASAEANAHPGYKARVVAARSGDTLRTTLFGPEWPGQMARVIANEGTRLAAGREAAALAEAKGRMIGTVVLGGERIPVPAYSAILPTPEFDADLDWACLTAGEIAATIDGVAPAAAIVAQMTAEAEEALATPAFQPPTPSADASRPLPTAPRPG